MLFATTTLIRGSWSRLSPHRGLSSDPRSVYKDRLTANELSPDDHQARVIDQFQRLHADVTGFEPLTVQHSSSFLSSASSLIFGPSSKRGRGSSQVPQGVYLWGTVGGGKTMLMDLYFDTIEAKDKKKARLHFHDFMLEVHHLMHEAKKSAPPRDVAKWDTYQPFDPIPPVGQVLLSRWYMLCLDEFQVTDIADAMILKQLFSYLFNHGLIIVATSNRPPDDLYKNGLQRSNFLPFIDILKDRCQIVSLDPGVDYRRKALGGSEKLYFLTNNPVSTKYGIGLPLYVTWTGSLLKEKGNLEPLLLNEDDNATENLSVMFKFLAAKETDDTRPRTIRIKARDVNFEKTCGGIADCSFEELCGRPLWTNDYLTMTQVFHTVFIRDIPLLTRKNRSEARRFITLIDTFYDHKIRVVCSGAAPYWELFRNEDVSDQEKLDSNRMLLDDLGIKAADSGSMDASVFSGEEELFAFDRTVSRLTEMQTKDYWKKWKTHMSGRGISVGEEQQ